MKTLELFQIGLFVLLFLLSIFIAFGTSIWMCKTNPFSKLTDEKISNLSSEEIDLTTFTKISIKKVSEIEKCGKKIIVSQFLKKQIDSFRRKAWEDWIKAWLFLAVISLIILCFQLKNFSKDINFQEIIHYILNTFISTLISFGIFGTLLKVFFEFWLLKSQVHDQEDVLD